MIAVLFQRVLSYTSYQGTNIDASIQISGSVRFGWSIGCRARHCPRFPVRGPIAGDRGGYPQPVSGRSAGDPQRKILEIAIKPAAQIPEIYRYDRTLRCGFLKQKQLSPLIFVIADAGGGHTGRTAEILQKVSHKAGLHVIVLPSATHPHFVTAAAATSAPRHAYDDAKDLYKVMEAAHALVKDRIEVTDFFLTGHSLGGLVPPSYRSQEKDFGRARYIRIFRKA
jgi:hypothetical protein